MYCSQKVKNALVVLHCSYESLCGHWTSAHTWDKSESSYGPEASVWPLRVFF
jgi:hypothetical protein